MLKDTIVGRVSDRPEGDSMADIVIVALILDLLEWRATGERGYEEVIDVWRTSCCPETGGLGECERSGTGSERASGTDLRFGRVGLCAWSDRCELFMRITRV